MDNLLANLVISIVFAVLGFVLLFLGYRTFDGLDPAHLRTAIFEEGNISAAIVVGAFIIGLAMVVAAAIS